MACPNCGFESDPETGDIFDVTYPCPQCGRGGAVVHRVASRHLAGYFQQGDLIMYGKYKNKAGRIVRLFEDEKGHPAVEIEPIPKGRKQNKVFGLLKLWKATPEQVAAIKVKEEQAQ